MRTHTLRKQQVDWQVKENRNDKAKESCMALPEYKGRHCTTEDKYL